MLSNNEDDFMGETEQLSQKKKKKALQWLDREKIK